MTMLGRWDRWWEERPGDGLGGTEARNRGAAWLRDCVVVEDWGCGPGRLRDYVEAMGHTYRGIDGSGTPDVIADLREYRPEPMVPGIFMRGVLEHNVDWRAILSNLCASFTERAAVVIFTPFQDVTRQLSYDDDPGVPVIGFDLTDLLLAILGGVPGARFLRVHDIEHFDSPGTTYRAETILYLER